ncbi:hypothetical protein TEA_018258 [Camellia sinensis var. sinensis]|uniref:Uso1/p115-like vesicle tethering protein C-terminal domain-containing protein n=1 Tax=Camellia sinensis var. sinensis TaxID=542762 RepID=A0A4S4DAB3_CAMSN|nr:hypothetical protein TEA_018258 [Camellia sinensis var. sinensis]
MSITILNSVLTLTQSVPQLDRAVSGSRDDLAIIEGESDGEDIFGVADEAARRRNCVQGVVGLVFGNENSASSEDSYVEQLHDRISNGVLAEDRRTAIAELQFVVTESRTAQLAFGAIAFGACSSCKIQFIKFYCRLSGTFKCLEGRVCIGDLIANHPKNLDALASKVLGEEPQVEPALYSILRIILRTSNIQEFVAANYVFKCFREKNLDGQAMLASTLIPQPQPTTHAPPEEDVNMSFGRPVWHLSLLGSRRNWPLFLLILFALVLVFELVTCSRAASVLSHVLKDSIQCKERFVDFIRNLEVGIRESVVDVYSHPKSKVAVVLVELQHKSGESDVDFIKRLKSFVEKQCSEITLDTLKTEKTKIESEASMYCNLAGKMESNLKSLSDAYNSLEQANFHLEKEIKALKSGGATPIPDVEAVKAKAREEAQKESEVELNDLLVCLGQEQSKVEKLSVRLLELGEDVNKLLEGIGDDIGLLEDVEVEED